MLSTVLARTLTATVLADFQIIFERDPAARNWLEVLLCYPGLHALLLYRLAHQLCNWSIPVLPRFISQIARLLTGIEIHPGATLGKGIFIDHGMGVVIGETAIVGDYSLIYQGVTLGGTGKESGKRHPTLGSNVVVGAGAKVLGNLKIGDNARIGAGSVVLRDVPVDCTVVGIPGRVVYRTGSGKIDPLDHAQMPDSEAKVIRMLLDRIDSLERQMEQLRDRQGQSHTLAEVALEKVALVAQAGQINGSSQAEGAAQADGAVNGNPATNGHYGSVQGAAKTSCALQNREIEAFLDGAGI